MTGKSFLRVCLLFACVVFLVSMLSSNVLADDIDTASQPQGPQCPQRKRDAQHRG